MSNNLTIESLNESKPLIKQPTDYKYLPNIYH